MSTPCAVRLAFILSGLPLGHDYLEHKDLAAGLITDHVQHQDLAVSTAVTSRKTF